MQTTSPAPRTRERDEDASLDEALADFLDAYGAADTSQREALTADDAADVLRRAG